MLLFSARYHSRRALATAYQVLNVDISSINAIKKVKLPPKAMCDRSKTVLLHFLGRALTAR